MRRSAILLIPALISVAALNCKGADAVTPKAPSHGMRVTSSAFEPNGRIPVAYTCQGAGTSPPLAFQGVPPTARTSTGPGEVRCPVHASRSGWATAASLRLCVSA